MGNFLFPDRLICPPRSTYYPHPLIDIAKLPVTDAYPYVKEVTFKKWKPMARVGMIVTTTINGREIVSKANYTQLTNDNCVILNDLSENVCRKINRISKLLTSGFYPTIMFAIRCIRFVRFLPRRIVYKMKRIYCK